MKRAAWRKAESFTFGQFTVYVRHGKDDDGSGRMVWRANIMRTAPPLHCGSGKAATRWASIDAATDRARGYFRRQLRDIEQIATLSKQAPEAGDK